MSLNRFNPRRDENEPQIRKRFAAHGWHTEQVSGKGMPDLLCWPPEYGHPLRWPLQSTFLVDVKMPKGKLEPAQEKKWAELAAKGIPVYVVRTEADVDALVRGELEPWKPELPGVQRSGLCTKCKHLRSAHGRRGCDRAHARRIGKCGCSGDVQVAYTPPRSTPVDAAHEAEETFAPSPHPDTCRCVTCGPARICE